MSDTWSGQSQIDEVLASVRSTMKKTIPNYEKATH